MKVLQISPTVESGGGQRYVYELANHMSEKIDTSLLIFGKERKTKRAKNLKIEIYPAHEYSMVSLGPFRVEPFWFTSLEKINNFDIIHVHQFRRTFSNIALFYSKLMGRPVFVTDHGGTDFLSNVFFSFIAGRMVDCFLPVSNFSAKSLLRYGMHSEVIYGGVDVEKFYPRPVEKEPGKVLFVGRLALHKGCEFLIKAIQDLSVTLSIVSPEVDSDYVKFLKTLDKNGRVNFKFGLSDKELIHEYCTSNITILPSVYVDYYGNYHPIPELLGLTLLESMACGTPVICTNVGGMPEIVKNGKTGFIVNPGDTNSLRDSIEYFCSNPKEVKLFGNAGRAEVMKSYTWDSVVTRCMIAYEEFS